MDADLTFGCYLDEWLMLQRTHVEPTTWRSYTEMIRYYVRPHVGEVRLGSLSVRTLDLLYVETTSRHRSQAPCNSMSRPRE